MDYWKGTDYIEFLFFFKIFVVNFMGLKAILSWYLKENLEIGGSIFLPSLNMKVSVDPCDIRVP